MSYDDLTSSQKIIIIIIIIFKNVFHKLTHI